MRILEELQDAVPDVEGAMVASVDGLEVASTLGGGEGTRVAAMAATVRALGVRVVEATAGGPFEEATIRSGGGIFTVYEAGELATLAVVSCAGANLGLLNLVARQVAEIIGQILAPTRYEPVPATSPVAPEAHAPVAPVTPAPAVAPSAWQDEPSYQAATA